MKEKFSLNVHSKNSVLKRIWSFRVLYLMLLPIIAGYLIFCYAPMYGIIIAFKDYSPLKGILGSPWAGFEYFKMILSSEGFWKVFRNTIEINLLRLLFAFPAPIILALLLNELRSRTFKRSIQTIVYLPYFISWVIIAGIMQTFLSTNGGVINNIIEIFGGRPISFLTEPSLFRAILVISGIWKDAGYSAIIYLAAISSISMEMYEAAIIDGANRLKQTIYITLPCIIPTISIMLILSIGSMLHGGFDQVYNLYNPMVYEVGDVIDTFIFRTGINQARFSLATAAGLFLSITNFALLFMANKIIKRINGSGIY